MRNQIQKTIYVISALMIFTSCRKDPNKFVVPLNPSEWTDSKKFTEAVSDLPSDDREIVLRYLKQYSKSHLYTGESTFWKILELNQERIEQAEMEAEIRDQNFSLLRRSIDVNIISTMHAVTAITNKMTSIVIADIEIVNLTDNSIKGVKGTIQFKDSVGALIAEADIAETKSLSPREKREVQLLLENQKIPSPLLDQSNFDMFWRRVLLVFEDGREIRF